MPIILIDLRYSNFVTPVPFFFAESLCLPVRGVIFPTA
jgi:hypothetical protein